MSGELIHCNTFPLEHLGTLIPEIDMLISQFPMYSVNFL